MTVAICLAAADPVLVLSSPSSVMFTSQFAATLTARAWG
jgi:hypothetical protein